MKFLTLKTTLKSSIDSHLLKSHLVISATLFSRKQARPKETKPYRGAKQVRVTKTLVDRRGDSQVGTLAWTPTIILDGASLPFNASIRNFQQGNTCYVADAMEQALLLPEDMADWRSIRKHEVFLNLKRDLALVSPPTTFFLPLS